MHKILIVLLVAVLAMACGSSGPAPDTPAATPTPVEFKTFTDGGFVVRYPDWPEDANRGSESILGVAQGPFGVWVNRADLLPYQAVRETRNVLTDQQNATLISETRLAGQRLLAYTFPFEDITLRYRALFTYCQGRTYVTAVAGEEQRFQQRAELFERVLNSARCEDPLQPPGLTTGKLGMIINPVNDDPVAGYRPAMRTAKEGGVQVSHFFLSWGDVEQQAGQYDWNWMDHVMDLHHGESLEISLVVDVVHTTVRGKVPPDLSGAAWDDPDVIQRFSTFILTFLDRYPGDVSYLSIGNEVNDYFIAHRDEIEAYRTFFLAVKQAIATQHPDVQVGMTFAYHDAERQGGLDIVERLNVGDFTPYTLYIYNDTFRFDGEPAALNGYVERMLALAGDKPVAIVELGWNTATSLGGSEEEQAALVHEAFRLLRRHRDAIEYLTWSELHDGRPENCRQAALSFIPPGSDLAEDEAFMGVFVDFLCYLGLRENDGTPKLGWQAWIEETEQYLAE